MFQAITRFFAPARPYVATLFSFGLIQVAQLVLPLLALPWLAHVLGPDAFGLLMYMSVLIVVWGMVMDWGLAVGGARRVAANRENPDVLAQTLADVLAAKFLLLLGCGAASIALMPFLPHAAAHPAAYGAAVAAGLVRGFNPTWFFQGLGNSMRLMAVYDVGSSALILVLTVFLVQSPQDWPLYMALTAICKGLPYAWLTLALLRRYPHRTSLAAGYRMLTGTSVLFVGVLASLVYSSGGQLIMGHFLPPAQMGILLVADKIVRAAISLGKPITETIYPEISALRATQPDAATGILRFSLRLTLGLMLLATLCIWICAPWLVQLALGQGYEQASGVLRIVACLAPILGCNFVLGSQILVPFGREKALTAVQCAVALASAPLAVVLCLGGDVSLAALYSILVEGVLLLGLVWHVRRVCPAVFFVHGEGR